MESMISSDIWFEVLSEKQKLSEQEKMWLKVGYEAQFVGAKATKQSLRVNLEDYFDINHEIKPHQLRAKTRVREVVEARQMIFHCLRANTDMSLNEIGKYYGKDHATVLHGQRNVDNLLDIDKTFRIKYLHMLHWVGLGSVATRLGKRYEDNPRKRPVRRIDSFGNVHTFDSVALAALSVHGTASGVNNCINGFVDTYSGYKFMYA